MNHVMNAATKNTNFTPGGLAAETAASIISAAIGAQATSVAESAATKAKAEAVLAAALEAKAHKEEVKEDRAATAANRAEEKHTWAREAQSRKRAKRHASEAFRLRDCLEAEGGIDMQGLEDLVTEVGRWAVTDRKDLLRHAKEDTAALISAWGF